MPEPTGNDRIARERAALRRVATLVGSAAAPEAEFATLEIDLPLRDPAGPPPPDAADPGQRFGKAGAAPRAAPGPPALDRDVRPPG